ncbi:MAG TPA: chloride channel protein [Planctomycetota bacterium]
MSDGTGVRFKSGSRWGRTVLLSVLVGVLAGLAAKVLHSGIHLGVEKLIGPVAQPWEPHVLRFRWGVLLLPALGGLLSGAAVALFCRPVPVEGTGQVVDAFHHRGGQVALREAAIKAGLAVGVISLGGSVGIEGVITVLGAAIGAKVATSFGLSPRERRLFLLAGCAAGVGAIFQCPLGGALFAVELLYREPEIESDGLLPSIIASVTSYSTFMAFGGYGRRLLEHTEALRFGGPVELLAYGVLGVLCAGAAAAFYASLRGSRALAARSRLPAWAAPAAAGLLVGAIACALPQVMDARYDFLQAALDARLFRSERPRVFWTLLFGLLVLAKIGATTLMTGTKTAGGLFGPLVFVGGAVGAFTGELLRLFLPNLVPDDLRAALIPVGMAGLLSSSLRVPLASIVMVTEMTGSYGLIVPLMLVSVVSYALGRRWGIDPDQLAGPEESPAHAGESIVGLLEHAKVKDLADLHWPHAVAPSTPLAEIISRFPAGSKPLVVVLDGHRLAGVITPVELVAGASVADAAALLVAADLMAPVRDALRADDDLYGTLDLFRRLNAEALPVVENEHLYAGVLTRAAILDTVRQGLTRERVQLLREHSGLNALAQEGRLQDLFDELAAPAQDAVRRLPVPAEAVGKSLRELDFRRRHGAQVIAIETLSEGVLSPPDPSRPLKKEDILVLLPSPKA